MKANIDFRKIGEIRFGPPLYELSINGSIVTGRSFFRNNVFDANEERMAVTEYWSAENTSCVSTLWMIDLESMNAFVVAKLLNGVIRPVRFEGPNLVYLKEPFGDVTREYERDITKISSSTFLGS